MKRKHVSVLVYIFLYLCIRGLVNSFESLIDCRSLSINDNKIRKSFFQSMENAKKDLKKEVICLHMFLP